VIYNTDQIVSQYLAQGWKLTIRQLYYQFVARNLFPDSRKYSWTGTRWVKDPEGTKNAEPNYNLLSTTTSEARLAGLIDWDAFEDRTRKINQNSHWQGPADILQVCVDQYREDSRATQKVYVEVWVEKDALLGVLERACQKLDCAWFACRGYSSQTAMHEAAKRIRSKPNDRAIVFYLGDHDPSGVDMTRDIQDRLDMFGCYAEVDRIALTMEQVKQYNPPSDPAKQTDSRYERYCADAGTTECWELDALDPDILVALINDAVNAVTDQDTLDDAIQDQEVNRELLRRLMDNI